MDGNYLRDENPQGKTLREAYARYLLGRNHRETVTNGNGITVVEACQSYLDQCADNGAETTYQMRAGTLFDFGGCQPDTATGKPSKNERGEVRIHDGYGKLLVSELLPLHVDQWLAEHPTWKGGGELIFRRSNERSIILSIPSCCQKSRSRGKGREGKLPH